MQTFNPANKCGDRRLYQKEMQKYRSVSSELGRTSSYAVPTPGNFETEPLSGCTTALRQLGEKLRWKIQSEFKRVSQENLRKNAKTRADSVKLPSPGTRKRA